MEDGWKEEVEVREVRQLADSDPRERSDEAQTKNCLSNQEEGEGGRNLKQFLAGWMTGWMISRLPEEGIKIACRFGSEEPFSQDHIDYVAVTNNLKISLA